MSEAATTELITSPRNTAELVTYMRQPFVADELKALLPSNTDRERFLRVLVSEVKTNHSIQKCQPMSIVRAAAEAARAGLEVGGGAYASAHLIRYGKECSYQPNHRGLCDLAFRGGEVVAVNAEAIRREDDISVINGRITHRIDPLLAPSQRGDVVGYYAILSMRTGAERHRYMHREDVQRHCERFSRGWQWAEKSGKRDSPWHTDFDAMAIKTVILQALKTVPMSVEVRQQLSEIVAADAAPLETEHREVPQDAPEAQSGMVGLEARVAATSHEAAPPVGEDPGGAVVEHSQTSAFTANPVEPPPADKLFHDDYDPTPDNPARPEGPNISPGTVKAIHAALKDVGYTDETKKRKLYQFLIRRVCGRPSGMSGLTEGEGRRLLQAINSADEFSTLAQEYMATAVAGGAAGAPVKEGGAGRRGGAPDG